MSGTVSAARPAASAPSRTWAVAPAKVRGETPLSRMTPSATSPASRRFLGPLAARCSGTAGWGSRSRERSVPAGPVNSCSSPFRRARSTVRPSRISAVVLWRRLTGATELSPTPSPKVKRPKASSATLRAAEATTAGWRVTRAVTAAPRPIRSVPSAAAVSVVNTSRDRSCEAGNRALSKPSSSALRTEVTIRSARSQGGIRTPTANRCGAEFIRRPTPSGRERCP